MPLVADAIKKTQNNVIFYLVTNKTQPLSRTVVGLAEFCGQRKKTSVFTGENQICG